MNTLGDCAIPGEGDAVSMAVSIASAVGTLGASTAAEVSTTERREASALSRPKECNQIVLLIRIK